MGIARNECVRMCTVYICNIDDMRLLHDPPERYLAAKDDSSTMAV